MQQERECPVANCVRRNNLDINDINELSVHQKVGVINIVFTRASVHYEKSPEIRMPCFRPTFEVNV